MCRTRIRRGLLRKSHSNSPPVTNSRRWLEVNGNFKECIESKNVWVRWNLLGKPLIVQTGNCGILRGSYTQVLNIVHNGLLHSVAAQFLFGSWQNHRSSAFIWTQICPEVARKIDLRGSMLFTCLNEHVWPNSDTYFHQITFHLLSWAGWKLTVCVYHTNHHTHKKNTINKQNSSQEYGKVKMKHTHKKSLQTHRECSQVLIYWPFMLSKRVSNTDHLASRSSTIAIQMDFLYIFRWISFHKANEKQTNKNQRKECKQALFMRQTLSILLFEANTPEQNEWRLTHSQHFPMQKKGI